MPKRERSGRVSIPALVVAPIRENFGRDREMDRALGPESMMMSSLKSSIAG